MEDDRDIKHTQELVLELLQVIDRTCQSKGISYSLAYGSVLGAVRNGGFIPWDTDVDIVIPISSIEFFRKAVLEDLPDNMCLHKRGEKKYHPCFDRISFKDISHEELHVDVFTLCGLPDEEKKRTRFINRCYNTYHLLCCKRKDVNYSHKKKRMLIRLIKVFLFFIPDALINRLYEKMIYKYPYDNSHFVSTLVSPYKQNDFMDKAKLSAIERVPFEGIMLPIPKDYKAYLSHIYGSDYMIPKRYER